MQVMEWVEMRRRKENKRRVRKINKKRRERKRKCKTNGKEITGVKEMVVKMSGKGETYMKRCWTSIIVIMAQN